MKKIILQFIFLINLFAQKEAELIEQNKSKYLFENTAISEELHNSIIYDMLQDSLGFLWLASDNGLYKYDGYEFTVYRHDPNNPYSISHNHINTLLESCYNGDNVLWIGTHGGGLNRLDLKTERFKYYKFDPQNPNSLSHNSIEVIYEDKNSILWIGTQGGGLNKFDSKTELFSHFFNKNWICKISEDTNGVLWLAAYNKGCIKFNPQTEQFINYTGKNQNSHGLSNHIVSSILVDNSNTVWVGTYRGLNKLVYEDSTGHSAEFIHYIPEPGNKIDGSIYSIFEKDEDNLWISTLGGGLYEFNKNLEHFKSIYRYSNYPSALITKDFGENWVERSNVLIGRNSFNTIEFENDQSGWLSGKEVMLKTEDGGETWFSLPIGNDLNIRGVDFVNNELGWAISHKDSISKILNTRNGGQEWDIQMRFIDDYDLWTKR